MSRTKKDHQCEPPQTKFIGFSKPASNWFKMPIIWIEICAFLDNLAELKVIQYVLYHTWGPYEYGLERRITVDEFMFGCKNEDGTRMDSGTGLQSEQSVRNGLKKALEHGFLVCTVDMSNKANIKKYYALALSPEESLEAQRMDPRNDHQKLEAHFLEAQILESAVSSNRPSKVRPPTNLLERKEKIRKKNDSSSPHPTKNTKPRTPQFIRAYGDEFSRKFNDLDHIGSNIVQMKNIYLSSELGQESFIEKLYEARDLALAACIKKTNSRGYPNRMPYFFSCLKNLIGIDGEKNAK